jgi:oxygen-independent coproporphyrinogen-3 oxidase
MNVTSEQLLEAPAVLSEALLRRFDTPGPRYTSYPTADRFVEAFGDDNVRLALVQRAQGGVPGAGAGAPLSVYVHIPFCESVCYYCACNKVITKHHERSAEYLDALDTEIDLVVGDLGAGQRVSQLHFGGGSPTFLSDAELERVMDSLRRAFRIEATTETSIEVDPRTVTPQRLAFARLQPHQLRRAGFRSAGSGGRAPCAALRERARPDGLRARARFRVDQRRPDLRAAAADAG